MNQFLSEEAEKSAICALLKTRSGIEEKLSLLSEEDFGVDVYRRIYRAIQSTAAHGQDVNVATVSARIRTLYQGDEAGTVEGEMMLCLTCGASPVMYKSYADAIRELSLRRHSIALIEDIGRKLTESADVNAVFDELRTKIIKLQRGTFQWVDMTDVMLRTFEYIEKRAKGEIKSIATGIPALDNLIGGLFAGEMTIVGARPAVGKSAFALNIAYAAAKQGFKVGYVSREMTDVQLGSRLLAREAMINGMRLRKADGIGDEEWFQISAAITELSELGVSFLFSVRTVEDLRREVQRRVESKQLDLLIVDYLQLMDTTQRVNEDHLRVARVSKELKQMALDFNIPVVALAQVKRDAEGALPELSSLKDSGSIEQDADGVIFLHRPTNPNDSSIHPNHKAKIQGWIQTGFDYIVVNVAKQRQGQIGKAWLLFDKAYMRYDGAGD